MPRLPSVREEVSGDRLRREVAAGAVAVEYRIRCLLGPGSVRAANALALAAQVSRFDELRREMFAVQPSQGGAGFTAEDLVALGARAGLHDPEYLAAVRQGRYEQWARKLEKTFRARTHRAPRPPSWTVKPWPSGCCMTRRHSEKWCAVKAR